ncbi:Hyphally regulated cell wall protein N-terminal-domain-containing protein [Scheffersomyces amazonensis]|uniref:Hyphally regulated cell wall protein N-terminal-domain-containing protein n=1 Tax=Scheffersomyces amazonensis TaxID=1078765 RepID=UPI00315DB9A3
MKVASLICAIAIQFLSTLAYEIVKDEIDYGFCYYELGDINIAPNVDYSIINNAITETVGDLHVGEGGGFYISSFCDLIGLHVSMHAGDVHNKGIISFNSLESILPSTYIFTTIENFINDGSIYMGSNGAVVPGIFTINAPVVTNNGLMVFYQTENFGGKVILGGTNLLNGISNNGQICLYNELYEQLSDINGSGCITSQENSTVFIKNPLADIGGQTIYLADPRSSVIANPVLSGHPINVAGFGEGNMVSLSTTLLPNVLGVTRPFSYNAQSGHLTLYSLPGSQVFNIGTGYNEDDFEVTTDWSAVLSGVFLPFNAVTYKGPVPNPGLPSNCALCSELPPVPGKTGTEYTTTVTIKYPDYVCTDVEDVIITSDSQGSYHISSSLITETCSYAETIPPASSTEDSSLPSNEPSSSPSTEDSSLPSSSPSTEDSSLPSEGASTVPSTDVSTSPSEEVSTVPSTDVSTSPSEEVSTVPSTDVSTSPSEEVSTVPSTDVSTSPCTESTSSPSEEASTVPCTESTSSEVCTLPSEGASSLPCSEAGSSPSGEIPSTEGEPECPSSDESCPFTTTIITTDSNEEPCTSTVVVVVTTNDNGETYTSNSIVENEQGGSVYTTTIVITDTAGTPSIVTGFVSVGIDSQGNEYTSSGILPSNPTAPGDNNGGANESSQAPGTVPGESSGPTSPSTAPMFEGSSTKIQSSILFTLVSLLIFTIFV